MHQATHKIDFKEAIKMLDSGYYIMHLNYLLGGESSEIYRQNRDCSHFLVKGGQDWRNPNNPIILVIEDAEAKQKYLGSRAGLEKYGDRDRTYEEIIVENQLLKKVIRSYLHDSASPIAGLRSNIECFQYWTDQIIEKYGGDKEYGDNLKITGTGTIDLIDILVTFRKTLWQAVDRRNPANNDELRNIIADIEKILSESQENSTNNSERIQNDYPPIKNTKTHWEYECPRTGRIHSVYWDIKNIFGNRMRGMGAFHNASWKNCLKRYATNISLSRLSDIKKSPEWMEAIKAYMTEDWIVIRSSERAARIFGISREKAHTLHDHGLDILQAAYKKGISYKEIRPHWNDTGYLGKK